MKLQVGSLIRFKAVAHHVKGSRYDGAYAVVIEQLNKHSPLHHSIKCHYLNNNLNTTTDKETPIYVHYLGGNYQIEVLS